MNVLFVKWKAYGQELLEQALTDAKLCVDSIFYDADKEGIAQDCGFLAPLSRKLAEKKYEFVISFNYFPVISTACERQGIKYAAWTVDSPLYTLYTRSVYNTCNYFFVFDMSGLKELKALGIKHVWYLPLAADVGYFDRQIQRGKDAKRFSCAVSFVGSLYTDKSAFHVLGTQKDYFAGYMEGLVEAQKKLWGSTFVEEVLEENMAGTLEKALVPINDEEFIGRSSKVFANSCILVEITKRERREYLEFLGRAVDVEVYTGSDTSEMSFFKNRGRVDYLTEMPMVFRGSKINLNITLRTIQQGISLRVWDILASGGFLLTNYQPELEEYFEIGRDLECFFDMEDMRQKVLYYLEHEEERAEIARNGREKVKNFHGYGKRIETILEKING